MLGLRIGAPALPAKDIAYLRALVRLFSYSEKLSWSFAELPPYHAVVAHHDTTAHAASGTVLTLVTARKPAGVDEIEYPIRADQFRDWLKFREAALRAPLSAAAAGSISLSEPDTTAAPASDANRYRLRRWPSLQELRNEPARMRLASLISKTALSVAELEQLSGSSHQACVEFIALLAAANLLRVDAGAATPTPAAAAAPAAPANTTAALARPGLLSSIRRRLGL